MNWSSTKAQRAVVGRGHELLLGLRFDLEPNLWAEGLFHRAGWRIAPFLFCGSFHKTNQGRGRTASCPPRAQASPRDPGRWSGESCKKTVRFVSRGATGQTLLPFLAGSQFIFSAARLHHAAMCSFSDGRPLLVFLHIARRLIEIVPSLQTNFFFNSI